MLELGMHIFPDISLGEFLLKCLSCQEEQVYVTGSNLLQLGDAPEGVTCHICKRSDNIITVQVPTRFDFSATNP